MSKQKQKGQLCFNMGTQRPSRIALIRGAASSSPEVFQMPRRQEKCSPIENHRLQKRKTVPRNQEGGSGVLSITCSNKDCHLAGQNNHYRCKRFLGFKQRYPELLFFMTIYVAISKVRETSKGAKKNA